METFLNYIEWAAYFHASFFIRMVFIFTVMMLYKNWVTDEKGFTWKPTLWKYTKWLWYSIAAPFAVIDIIYNWYSWFTFNDRPAAWDETVSYRMDRYIKQYKDKDNLTLLEKWRYYFALGLCKVLSFSDPKHCGDL